jgi:hypothetical protein
MRRIAALGLLAWAALFACRVSAADHFLTVGGGYSPSGNQVSLERNVLFFREVLTDLYPKETAIPPHEVLFSDGDSPGRDVQYDDPNAVPEVNRLLARLDDNEDDLGVRYRSHQIKNVRGPATRRELQRWFDDVGAKIPGGDRLVIYVTGHGGHGGSNDQKDFANNHLDLWNGERITVREFSSLLDKLPADVSVIVVMVQCYSGGFADLMFAGGESKSGLAKSVRCGFFATTPDRQAAGCTSNVNEETYEDYSTSFWAALRGKSRTGAVVKREDCDFDHDGVVTFAEAHAHVLLTDDSIDIPTTTSDRFLHLRSDRGDRGRAGGRLVSVEDMLARIEGIASPSDRAVIDGLSHQLELGTQYRYGAAKELADSLRAQHQANEQKRKSLQTRFDESRRAIRDTLELRWPELNNRWDPEVDKLLKTEADAIVKAIKSDSRYRRFSRQYDQLNELADRDDALETRWAKSQRLMYAIERVALAHNLPQVADEQAVARYKALVALEQGTLGSASR